MYVIAYRDRATTHRSNCRVGRSSTTVFRWDFVPPYKMPCKPAMLMVLLVAPVVVGCGGGEPAVVAPPRSQVESGPVRVTVEVEPARPRLSDRVTLTVSIDHAAGVTVEPPAFGEAFGDFAVVELREPLARIEQGREIRQQVLTLEPTHTGELEIWPVDVTFMDTRPEGDGREHVVSTEPLSVEVRSAVDAEAPRLADLRPKAGPLGLPFSYAAWIWGGAGGLVVLAAAGVLWWHCRGRKAIAPPRILTPAEIAMRELERIIEEDLAHRDVKRFYIELTGVVRRFIEQTTAIRAPEQTTEEFLREIAVRATFSPAENRRLKSFLEAADLVKFAAHRPREEDIEASLDRAKGFVGYQRGGEGDEGSPVLDTEGDSPVFAAQKLGQSPAPKSGQSPGE